MAKFNNMDFDLCGGMTDREFRDTLGALSAFVIYEDANGVHNGGVKASSGLFYNGSLSSKNPTSIWAIGAGVSSLEVTFLDKTTLVNIYGRRWDVSHVTNMRASFENCSSIKELDFSTWDSSSVTDLREFVYGCVNLGRIVMFGIPAGSLCADMFGNCGALTDVSFGPDHKIYPSVSFSPCPLTYQSVVNVFNALADTPDTGATITFKSGLYAAFTEEQKAVIDEKRAAAVTNGWAIVNMGGA